MDMVIGIGNDMRGDDGIGPRVVDAISARADLETMTVHQLVPELAEKICHARRVLFVDANLVCEEPSLRQLESAGHHGLGHACSPAALLGWTELAYGRQPEAWLLSIPGASFELGEDLSPQAAAVLPVVAKRIESWLSDCPVPVSAICEEEA